MPLGPLLTRVVVSPLSVDRTRVIIDRCFASYLKSRPGPSAPNVERAILLPLDSLSGTLGPLGAPSDYTIRGKPVSYSLSRKVSLPSAESFSTSAAHCEDTSLPHHLSPNIKYNIGHSTTMPDVCHLPPYAPPRRSSENLPERPSRRPPPVPVKLTRDTRGDYFGHALPSSSPGEQPEHSQSNPLTPREEKVIRQSRPAVKSLFKPLEDYIIRSFANSECLNASFLTARPRPHRGRYSEDDMQQRKIVPSEIPGSPDFEISELDAKTALLGDVAENGSWWTGQDRTTLPQHRLKHQRSLDMSRSTVHSRTPRINWGEVSNWYNIVSCPGEGWSEKRGFGKDIENGKTNGSLQDDDNEMRAEVAEASAHVQRTLLKATENLLKRPGRPLRTPDDMRFLLILLANPLLYPGTATVSHLRPSEEKSASPIESVRTEAAAKRPAHGRSLSWQLGAGTREQAYAFSVIKRTLGLLSNLPNECHHYLTYWFARYSEDQFRALVGLVQSFLTHRVCRQHGRKQSVSNDNAAALIPKLSASRDGASAELHAALGLGSQPKTNSDGRTLPMYSDDWQIRAAARFMALLFSANKTFHGERSVRSLDTAAGFSVNSTGLRPDLKRHGQLLSTSEFYSTMVDYSDLIADFDCWESSKGYFSFCQYPFLLSVGGKIRIMEHDARRQMGVKAREAFFNSILRNKTLEQYLVLKVRRDCLVEDSLRSISQVVGAGQEEIKKGLRIQFVDEEGVDAGGLRKEWFLLLVREIFDPSQGTIYSVILLKPWLRCILGMFIYDEDSRLCYFNPHSFENSETFFLVGSLLGLAIYNSTILDIALPPFTFRKLLTSGATKPGQQSPFNHTPMQYTLEDLAEYRPALAKGLRQLQEFDGNVEETYCRDFFIEVEHYGTTKQVPLCKDNPSRPVTNTNRHEFVDLYVRFLLDTQVARQFEPFKRGFFTVCGGNALSLFQPEEIELLIRGSDEPLDVPSLKAVAVYENWRRGDRQIENPADEVPLIQWFWEFFESASAKDQRKILSFVTGSDRIPAVGATNLIIKIAFGGKDFERFPIARTCFNALLLFRYRTREELAEKLWRAVTESEGFGLK